MQDDSFGGDFVDERVAEAESATDFGGGADEQVHGEGARTGEADFGGGLGT